jgi:uncharacterized damage-inducible protein DinB
MSGPRADRLATLLERTITGPMWHGPALDEVLANVTATQAAARPIAGAHSIFELVVHIRAWADIPRARLTRNMPAPTATDDWPAVGETSDAAWRKAVDGMRESYRALAADVRKLDDAALDGNVLGRDYTLYSMLHGVVEHGCYHGGQIALLKKGATVA